MKNTKEKARFAFLIYGYNDKYTAICFELGLVEQGKDLEEVHYRIINGAKAVIKTTLEKNLSVENLNQKPTFKYLLAFYFIPIFYPLISFTKNLFDLKKFTETSMELCNA